MAMVSDDTIRFVSRYHWSDFLAYSSVKARHALQSNLHDRAAGRDLCDRWNIYVSMAFSTVFGWWFIHNWCSFLSLSYQAALALLLHAHLSRASSNDIYAPGWGNIGYKLKKFIYYSGEGNDHSFCDIVSGIVK
jgi:hypothetical protein